MRGKYDTDEGHEAGDAAEGDDDEWNQNHDRRALIAESEFMHLYGLDEGEACELIWKSDFPGSLGLMGSCPCQHEWSYVEKVFDRCEVADWMEHRGYGRPRAMIESFYSPEHPLYPGLPPYCRDDEAEPEPPARPELKLVTDSEAE